MFKALNSRDGTEVISLDPRWHEDLSVLRGYDRQDALLCQGCREPVRLRAGEHRRRHFAHKHLRNCTFGTESPELLAARAALYERLVAVFGKRVTIEKNLDDPALPRPIDCWVENGEKPLAYWVFDSQMQPQRRDELRGALARSGASITWVFVAKMLKEPDPAAFPWIHPKIGAGMRALCLTTTGREFLCHTPYDADAQSVSCIGKTLHYLDADTGTLTTFRGLLLEHPPQVFVGRMLFTPMAEVQVEADAGGFVHVGEEEQLANNLRLQEEREAARKAREQRAPLPSQPPRIVDRFLPGVTPAPPQVPPIQYRATMPDLRPTRATPSAPFADRVGTCEGCGKQKTDRQYWSYDGKTGVCKCYECFPVGPKR